MAQPAQPTTRRSAGTVVLAIPLLAVLVLAGLGALFLLYLEPLTIAVGAGLLVAAVAVHLALRRSGGAPSPSGPREEAMT